MEKFKLILFFLALSLWSCDKPDDPYLDGVTDLGTAAGVVSYGTSFFESYESTVLLEDFTGYKCTNCGPALATAENLQEQWGQRLVVVGYHVLDNFAAPDISPSPPDFYFSKDFRTEEGSALALEYGINALPQGLVNRTNFGSGERVFVGDWSARVSDEMAETPQGFVQFLSDSTSIENDQLSFSVAVRPLAEVNDDWNLIVGIYENDIIEAQKDGGETIYPFSHEHVFRGYVNGASGQTVIDPSLNFVNGEATYYNFTTNLASDELQIEELENCYLFAFLQNADIENLEIYAVAKTPLL